MPSATFVLKEPKSKDETLIYLIFRFNKIRVKYSTGEKIKTRFWNKEKQRARVTLEFEDAEKLNTTLDNLSRAISDSYRDLINQKVAPTPAKLINVLDRTLFKNEYSVKTGFLKFIDGLIQNNIRKPNTVKQWKQTYRKLNEYKNATNCHLDFDTIDLDFYNSFIQFLSKEGYTKNSIGGFIKNIKVFMNEAVERKLTNNLEYRNKKFKVIEEHVDKIYLSQDELNSIYQLDLSTNPRLDKVRDLFLIACYTGLRFSDLIQIRPENFINNGTQIRVRTEKTGEIVIIPMHRIVREIISKYHGNLPSAISNQKMNAYLKEISKSAKLNSPTKIGITRGGKLSHETNKKFELVCTHTARRSFATNAFLMDIPAISIMKITGHRTEKSFMKYIRISQEENANKLLAHPFFN